jgi:hypothetical protein
VVREGIFDLGPWKVKVEESAYQVCEDKSSWKKGWEGCLSTYLPCEEFVLRLIPLENLSGLNKEKVKKMWTKAKVPALLYDYFPIVWDDSLIYHEFLTGKRIFPLHEGEKCWKVTLNRF